MHKDPPPNLLERPPKVIAVFGVLTGFVVGFVVLGLWSLLTTHNSAPRLQQTPAPIADRVR